MNVGNFEKLSVVVIVVIIVMILAVAVVEWTSGPAEVPPADAGVTADLPKAAAVEPPRNVAKVDSPKPKATLPAGLNKKDGSSTESGRDAIFEEWGDWDNKSKSTDKEEKKAAEGDKAAKTPEAVKPPTPTTTPDIAETTHVVVQGESLQLIAKKHYDKMSLWPVIVDANPGIRPESLRPGQTLKIPARKGMLLTPPGGSTAPASGPGQPVPGKEYTVRSNDTWERISAAAYNTSARWPEIYLKNLNRVRDQKDLPPGKVIMIPK
jgi:nucleoid-associated protein YgaU